MHVIDNDTDNLLSRNTAHRMGLITVVANVNDNNEKVTGCMKGDPVKITPRSDVVPYCHQLPGVCPFQYYQKSKKKKSFNV